MVSITEIIMVAGGMTMFVMLSIYITARFYSAVNEKQATLIHEMRDRLYGDELLNECNCEPCTEIRGRMRHEYDEDEMPGYDGTCERLAWLNGWNEGIDDEGLREDECFRTDNMRHNTW